MTHIAVVDHGAGNLVSIRRGLEKAGATVRVADSPAGLDGVDGVVLPGVGATASVMDGIMSGGFSAALGQLTVPLFGICVGMQVLFETSSEDGAECLGLIPGTVERLVDAPRLPHIGWNDLTVRAPDPLFDGVGPDAVTYFVHSYAPVPANPSHIVATAEYGRQLVAAVRSGTVSGTQFHPERSGPVGLRILANFVRSCGGTLAAEAS